MQQTWRTFTGAVRVVVLRFSQDDDPAAPDATAPFPTAPNASAPGGPSVVTIALLPISVSGRAVAWALQCDLLIAADSITLTLDADSALAGRGASKVLVDRVGYTRAIDLLLAGGQVSARDAARWGLVTEAVPAAELIDALTGRIERILLTPRGTAAELKSLLGGAGRLTQAEQRTAELAAAQRLADEASANEAAADEAAEQPVEKSGTL